jgi:hypothetical protein
MLHGNKNEKDHLVVESIDIYLFHYMVEDLPRKKNMVEDLIKLLFSLIIGSLTSPDEAFLE